MQIFQISSGDGGPLYEKENVPSKTQKVGCRTGRKAFGQLKIRITHISLYGKKITSALPNRPVSIE